MPPEVEPTKVMVNGAAVSLLNSMFQSLQTQLSASEQRLSEKIDERIEAHELIHATAMVTMVEFRDKTNGRLHDLEQQAQEEAVADRLAEAKWWLPRAAAGFVVKHGAKIAIGLATLLGIVIGTLAHVQVTIV